MRNCIFVLLALLLASCHSSPSYTEQYYRSKEVYDKYHSAILGMWHYEENTNRMRYNCTFEFRADQSFTQTGSLSLRDSVVVEGHTVWGDWRSVVDTVSTGKWRMGWSEELNSNYIALDNKVGEGHVIEIKPFDITASGQFLLQVDGSLVEMRKGPRPQP